MHLYFDADVTAFRFIFRLNGMPILSAPITPPKSSNTVRTSSRWPRANQSAAGQRWRRIRSFQMYANAKPAKSWLCSTTSRRFPKAPERFTSGWVSAANFERFLAVIQTGVLGASATVDANCSRRPTPAAQAPRTSPARQSRRSSRRPATASRSKSTCGPKVGHQQCVQLLPPVGHRRHRCQPDCRRDLRRRCQNQAASALNNATVVQIV